MPITLDGTLGITTPALTVTGASIYTGGLTTAGNLTFSSTGQRIIGDFSNATVTNRVLFQTSTTNGNTVIGLIPNGTGTVCAFGMDSDPALTNSSTGSLNLVSGTDLRIQASIRGTGTYLPITFYTGGSERMRIDTSGNVGIGTTTPLASYNAALAVVSANTFGTITAKCTATTGAAGVFVQNDANTADCFMYAFNSASGSLNAAVGTSKAQSLVFYTNNSAKVYITSAGNVGIGVTSPTYNLEVSGNTKTTGYYSVNDVGYVRSSSGLLEFQGGSTATRFMDSSYSAELMRITQAGNVSIGTTSVYAKLSVQGNYSYSGQNVVGFFYSGVVGSSVINIQDFNSTRGVGLGAIGDNMIFYSSSASTLVEKMRLTSAGLVQISASSTNNTFTGSGELAIKNSTSNPFISFHNNTGTRMGYMQGNNGPIVIQSESSYLSLNDSTGEVARCTGGNFAFSSGYGSVATAYGVRAWSKFNTTTIAGSGNVSSMTNPSGGVWQMNFTNAMPDANYSAQFQPGVETNQFIKAYATTYCQGGTGGASSGDASFLIVR